MKMVEIAVTDIFVDAKANFRGNDDDGSYETLVQSVGEDGVRDPVDVVARSSSAAKPYKLVAGYRRIAAALEAGIETIPCCVYTAAEMPAKDIIKRNLQENINRRNLDPITEAEGAKKLMAEGMDEEEICSLFGWTPTMFQSRVPMAEYTDVLKEAVRENKVGIRAAAAIAELPEESHEQFVDKAINLRTAQLQKAVAKEKLRLDSENNVEEDEGEEDFEETEEEEELEEEEDTSTELVLLIQANLRNLVQHHIVDDTKAQSVLAMRIDAVSWHILPEQDLEQIAALTTALSDATGTESDEESE